LHCNFHFYHLHGFFNIYLFPFEYHIVQHVTNTKYIRHNCDMQFCLFELFSESLFHYFKGLPLLCLRLYNNSNIHYYILHPFAKGQT
jgi:hypothetical protein